MAYNPYPRGVVFQPYSSDVFVYLVLLDLPDNPLYPAPTGIGQITDGELQYQYPMLPPDDYNGPFVTRVFPLSFSSDQAGTVAVVDNSGKKVKGDVNVPKIIRQDAMPDFACYAFYVQSSSSPQFMFAGVEVNLPPDYLPRLEISTGIPPSLVYTAIQQNGSPRSVGFGIMPDLGYTQVYLAGHDNQEDIGVYNATTPIVEL